MAQERSWSSAQMKYAHLERERRFLLSRAPSGITTSRTLMISDLYLTSSTLRLRRVEEVGNPTIYKLGQKIRLDVASPSNVAHTSMYLSKSEFDTLATLPARSLEKVRRLVDVDGCTLCIDCFGGQLLGLVLCEVDLGETGTLPALPQIAIAAEVTEDARFAGGALAATSTEELALLLSSFQNP